MRTSSLNNGPDVSYGQSEYKRSNGYKHGGFRKSSYTSKMQLMGPEEKYVSVRHVYPIHRVSIEHPVKRIRNVKMIENPNGESVQWIKIKKIFQNFPGTHHEKQQNQATHYVVSPTIHGENIKAPSIKSKVKQANPDKMIMIVDNKITQMDDDDKDEMDEDDKGKFKFRKDKIGIPVIISSYRYEKLLFYFDKMLDFCAKTMDANGPITLKEKIGAIILRPILVAINVKRSAIQTQNVVESNVIEDIVHGGKLESVVRHKNIPKRITHVEK